MATKIAGLLGSIVLALAACGGGADDIKVEYGPPIQMYKNCQYRESYSGPPYYSCYLVGECSTGDICAGFDPRCTPGQTTCVACPIGQPLSQC